MLSNYSSSLPKSFSATHAIPSASTSGSGTIMTREAAAALNVAATNAAPHAMFPYDIFSDKHSYHIKFTLPGVPPENVSVEFDYDANELSISGKLKSRWPSKSAASASWTDGAKCSFARAIAFPSSVHFLQHKTTAVWAFGILEITLYKDKSHAPSRNFQKLTIVDSKTVREIPPKTILAIDPPPGSMAPENYSSYNPASHNPSTSADSIRSIPISMSSKSSHSTISSSSSRHPQPSSSSRSVAPSIRSVSSGIPGSISGSLTHDDTLSIRSDHSAISAHSYQSTASSAPPQESSSLLGRLSALALGPTASDAQSIRSTNSSSTLTPDSSSAHGYPESISSKYPQSTKSTASSNYPSHELSASVSVRSAKTQKSKYYDQDSTYEPSTRSSKYEPSTKSSKYEPSSRSSKYEPSTKSSKYEPSTRSSVYEPSTKSSQYEESMYSAKYEPSTRSSKYSSRASSKPAERSVHYSESVKTSSRYEPSVRSGYASSFYAADAIAAAAREKEEEAAAPSVRSGKSSYSFWSKKN